MYCIYKGSGIFNSYTLSSTPPPLTMLEQALANVMNFGLNCRQVMGPVCFPSNKATFMPLSAFHTWIFPSSEPKNIYEQKKNIFYENVTTAHSISLGYFPLPRLFMIVIMLFDLVQRKWETYQSLQTENPAWTMPPALHIYCCCSPVGERTFIY